MAPSKLTSFEEGRNRSLAKAKLASDKDARQIWLTIADSYDTLIALEQGEAERRQTHPRML
jgi:hypothetical protein